MATKVPPYLQQGDTIGIIACAGKIAETQIAFALQTFDYWGLKVLVGKNLFNAYHKFAATDEQRAADLQSMLDNHTVKAIISARGGYGTMRIIDKIDFTKFIEQPKWVIGYSDITVLHSHIHNLGIETIHSTMPINFATNSDATESLRKALFGEKINYTIPFNKFNRAGAASGELVGGNLSLLYALIGSASDIDTTNKLLFIEDLGEELYHLDRMMICLKRAEKLSHLAGLIVGGMTEMKDSQPLFGKCVEEIILDAVKEFNYPVCFDFPAGHIENNFALVLGTQALLNVEATNSSLKYIGK